ncbi:DNA-binding response regulator [Flavobacterium noncentrifugens]|nr:DNA-binding response regulator [Flavobacterium noncentrifugens]
MLLDDEIPGLTYLKMMCEQIPELDIVKSFTDPEKLLDEMPALDFDLVISDIEMPGIDGLTLAQSFKNKLVIFTTAYKEYAADAFDIDAVDYITKPVKMERLQKAVHKAVEKFNQQTPVKSITLNTDKGKMILYSNTIVLIRTSATESRDKEVLLNDDSVLILKNIKFETLLNELPTVDFCRISKKEIIAMKAVKFFSHNEITMNLQDKNGRFLNVILSEIYRPDFLSKAKT